MREVVIMEQLVHCNIIRCHSTIVKEKYICMFLDYMEGGDLLNRLLLGNKVSVETAKYYFRQMCAAVKYLHDQNIIHQDIKLDNILLKSNDELTELKLADFGLSKLFPQDNSELHTMCGSPLFMAPEISTSCRRTGAYTNKIDIWGLGVVLHAMFCPIFDEKKVKSGILNFEDAAFRSVPESAKDLIRKMLTVNSNDRPSINDVLMHPWLKEGGQNIDELNAMFEEKIKEPPKKKRRADTNEIGGSKLSKMCGVM